MMLSLLSLLLKLPRFEKTTWFTFDQIDLSLWGDVTCLLFLSVMTGLWDDCIAGRRNQNTLCTSSAYCRKCFNKSIMGNRLRCHLSCKAALLAVNEILCSYNLFEISSAVHSLGTLFQYFTNWNNWFHNFCWFFEDVHVNKVNFTVVLLGNYMYSF